MRGIGFSCPKSAGYLPDDPASAQSGSFPARLGWPFKFHIDADGHLPGLFGCAPSFMGAMHGQELPAKLYQTAWFERCTGSPDGHAPFADLPASKRVQVFMVFLVLPADTAVCEFLALCLLPRAGVDIDRVIELLQDPVIPPGPS